MIALRVLPIRFGWRYVDRTAFREIANYSAVSFILLIGYKLRYKTDEIVIGTFLSVTAITYFSIGDRLLDYAAELVASLAQIFVPMAGQSHAKGDTNRLRTIWIAGNRACALIIFPITALLIILGKSVITAWVGAKYVAQSYPVLVVLAVPMMFTLAQGASTRILYGMAKHRPLAIVTLMESIANLILSIVLIRPFGIIGDAFGTAIPLMLTSILFMPRHMCRLMGVRIGTYLREAYTLPVLLTLPLAATLLLVRQWFVARTVFEVAFQAALAFLPYGLGLVWAIRKKRAWQVSDLAIAPARPSGRRIRRNVSAGAVTTGRDLHKKNESNGEAGRSISINGQCVTIKRHDFRDLVGSQPTLDAALRFPRSGKNPERVILPA